MKIHSPRARPERVTTRVAVAIAACSFAFVACSDNNQGRSRDPSNAHRGADATVDLDGSAEGAAPSKKDGEVNSSSNAPETGVLGPDQLVILDLTGVVDAVSPLTGALPFPVSAGDQLRGVYAFDPAKAKLAASGGVTTYAFDNLPGRFELHLDVGDLGVVSAPLDPSMVQSTISVGDDVESTDGALTDSYVIEVKQATAPGFFGQAIDFTLRLASTKDLGAVRSASLSIDPPDVSRFDDAPFVIHAAGGEVRGHATAVTRSRSTVNAGVCGDGVLNYGEECDDFNDRDGDGCDSCRFTCVATDPDRGCDTGDVCNGPATCLDATHTCVPGPEKPNFTRCADNRVCWQGACMNVDADPSRFATFTFKAYIDKIEPPVISVPPPGILYADSINGAFTIDVSAAPASQNKTKSEFAYTNEPGGFALYATVGPLHLQASKLDAKNAGSNVRVGADEYDVDVGQLVALGSPVAPSTFAITLTDPETALSTSSPLAIASTQFAGGTISLTYGGFALHANISFINRASGGTARLPVVDAGSDGGPGPVPPLDGGNIVTGRDAGTVPISPRVDAGTGGTTTPTP